MQRVVWRRALRGGQLYFADDDSLSSWASAQGGGAAEECASEGGRPEAEPWLEEEAAG